MKPEIGKNYLITTDNWFFAPDGECYRAVWGTVNAILSDEETLGIKTNRNSTNWYVSIGRMVIAGCQIHYAIQTDVVDFSPPKKELEHNGESFVRQASLTRIFNANI